MMSSAGQAPAGGPGYSGGDVLEIMDAAVNYNKFLVDQVIYHAEGARRYVDFGAGIGTLAAMVRARGVDVTCVELDDRQRDVLAGLGFTAYRELASLEPDSVDYLYTCNVLEHIQDDLAAARAIFQVLRPGGRCLAYVPAFNMLYSSFDTRIGHLRRYTRASLATVFRSAGFALERQRYCDSLGFLAALAFKALDRGDGQVSQKAVVQFDRFVFPFSRRCDGVTGRLFGKNVLVVAKKPGP